MRLSANALNFLKKIMKNALLLVFVMVAAAAQAQIIKTSLTVTVRDDLGNTVEGATVKLFENEADYNAEKNPSAEGTTDGKGNVKFKDMKAIPYFILVRKGDKDNAGKGEQTGALQANKFNKVTIIIE